MYSAVLKPERVDLPWLTAAPFSVVFREGMLRAVLTVATDAAVNNTSAWVKATSA